VWVEHVKANSPAAKSGLKPGDVIQQVNGQTVHSHFEIFEFLGPLPGIHVFRIFRNGKVIDVEVETVSQNKP